MINLTFCRLPFPCEWDSTQRQSCPKCYWRFHSTFWAGKFSFQWAWNQQYHQFYQSCTRSVWGCWVRRIPVLRMSCRLRRAGRLWSGSRGRSTWKWFGGCAGQACGGALCDGSGLGKIYCRVLETVSEQFVGVRLVELNVAGNNLFQQQVVDQGWVLKVSFDGLVSL